MNASPNPACLPLPQRISPPSSPSELSYDLSKYSVSSSNIDAKFLNKVKLPPLQSVLGAVSPVPVQQQQQQHQHSSHQVPHALPSLTIQVSQNSSYPYSPLSSRSSSSSSLSDAPVFLKQHQHQHQHQHQPSIHDSDRPPMLSIPLERYGSVQLLTPNTPTQISPIIPVQPHNNYRPMPSPTLINGHGVVSNCHPHHPHHPHYSFPPSPVSVASPQSLRFTNPKKKRTNLPKKTTIILLNWLNDNLDHPYPNSKEKLELIRKTGLSNQQLANWFINARRRKIQLLRDIKANSQSCMA